MPEELKQHTHAMEITGSSEDCRFLIQEMVKAMRGADGRASSRAKALAITKLQEAAFWLGEDMFGAVP